MDPSITVIGALLLGMATSFHCVGMCGPIACGLGGLAKSDSQRLTGAVLYHSLRMLSYGIIGAVCGALGRQPLLWFFDSPAVLLPWVMVLVLLLVASGLDKRLPRPAFVARLTTRARFKAARFSAPGAAAAMGLLTPLLPCGPLYAMFALALLSGSAVKGAEFAVTFGLGTVPLLWLAQWQMDRLRMKLTPRMIGRVQRGLAFATAVVLAWRLHSTIPPQWYGQEIPTAADGVEETLPSCCH